MSNIFQEPISSCISVKKLRFVRVQGFANDFFTLEDPKNLLNDVMHARTDFTLYVLG